MKPTSLQLQVRSKGSEAQTKGVMKKDGHLRPPATHLLSKPAHPFGNRCQKHLGVSRSLGSSILCTRCTTSNMARQKTSQRQGPIFLMHHMQPLTFLLSHSLCGPRRRYCFTRTSKQSWSPKRWKQQCSTHFNTTCSVVSEPQLTYNHHPPIDYPSIIWLSCCEADGFSILIRWWSQESPLLSSGSSSVSGRVFSPMIFWWPLAVVWYGVVAVYGSLPWFVGVYNFLYADFKSTSWCGCPNLSFTRYQNPQLALFPKKGCLRRFFPVALHNHQRL